MKTIWKFNLKITDVNEIEMPEGAIILTAMNDPSGNMCVWAEVDTSAEMEKRRIAILGTGHPMTENMTYIGSVQDAPFIWHVYELKVNSGPKWLGV